LDGKIGGLRPRHRNDTRCGAEEKTFHHLHLNLQVPFCREGSVSAGCDAPLEGPLSVPLNRPANPALLRPDRTTGDAPLRRNLTLIVRAHAGNNEEVPQWNLNTIFTILL